MKNAPALIVALCFLVSAAEIAYVGTTPLVGAGDIGSLEMDYAKVAPLEPYSDGYLSRENLERTNTVYRAFYMNRPHAMGVSKSYYAAYLLGEGTNDLRVQGDLLWHSGIFILHRDYPEALEDSSYGSLFSFAGIAGNGTQQQGLMEYLHAQDDSFPAGTGGISYLVSGRNLTLSRNGGTMLDIWVDSDGNCWYSRPGNDGEILGNAVEKGGNVLVYTDVLPKSVYSYGARAAASGIYPQDVSYICRSTGSAANAAEEAVYPGRQLSKTPLGWITLSELAASNSFALFDERFPSRLNITHEEFLTAYAETYRGILARLTYVESVLDGRTPPAGIYYLAYYPRYEKIWVVVKGVPEKDMASVKARIDGEEAAARILSPFLFIDAKPRAGNHVLTLTTPIASYKTSFYVDESPLAMMPIMTVLRDGNLSIGIASISPKKGDILLKEAKISWTLKDDDLEFTGGLAGRQKMLASGSETISLNKELAQYQTLRIDARIPAQTEGGERLEAEVAVTYVQDGGETQYIGRIYTYAET